MTIQFQPSISPQRANLFAHNDGKNRIPACDTEGILALCGPVLKDIQKTIDVLYVQEDAVESLDACWNFMVEYGHER